jgi:hydrogenase maturation protease
MTGLDAGRAHGERAAALAMSGAGAAGPGRADMLVIGIGNRYRGDDAAGLAVAERIRGLRPPRVTVLEMEGEPVGLLDMWGGAQAVYLVDAVSSGGEPGAVYRFDAVREPPRPQFRHRGTHTFSLADTVELARTLHCLPGRLVAYGIEGGAFALGTGLSAPVAGAVAHVSARLLAELAPG